MPPKLDKKNYMAVGLRNKVVAKTPGQIDGQQFIIEDCKGCTIQVLDHCAQVTIDDCSDCVIIVGPCADAVFARDCKQCKFHAVCQQWRTRDCVDCDIR